MIMNVWNFVFWWWIDLDDLRLPGIPARETFLTSSNCKCLFIAAFYVHYYTPLQLWIVLMYETLRNLTKYLCEWFVFVFRTSSSSWAASLTPGVTSICVTVTTPSSWKWVNSTDWRGRMSFVKCFPFIASSWMSHHLTTRWRYRIFYPFSKNWTFVST